MADAFADVFLTATPVVTDSVLIVPFIRGVYLDGGELVSVARLSSGQWVSSTSDPLLYDARGSILVAPVGAMDSLSLSWRRVAR